MTVYELRKAVSEDTILWIQKADGGYHTLSALEKLGISNSDMIQDIPYEDGVIVLAFICDDKVVTYTLINSSDEQASSLLDEYVYQLSGKTYPKGTVFE